MHRWHLAKVSPKDKIMMENPFVIQILTKHVEVKDDCLILFTTVLNILF